VSRKPACLLHSGYHVVIRGNGSAALLLVKRAIGLAMKITVGRKQPMRKAPPVSGR
jgi:hypothetical protein